MAVPESRFDRISYAYEQDTGHAADFRILMRVYHSATAEFNFGVPNATGWLDITQPENHSLTVYEGDFADIYVGLVDLVTGTPVFNWWGYSYTAGDKPQPLDVTIDGLVLVGDPATRDSASLVTEITQTEPETIDGYDSFLFQQVSDVARLEFGDFRLDTTYLVDQEDNNPDNDNTEDVFKTVDITALFDNIEFDGPGGPDRITSVGASGSFIYADLADDTYEAFAKNDPPLARDDYVHTRTTGFDVPPTYRVPVLRNDEDPDGDPLTVFVEVGPANGTARVNGSGLIVYNPNTDYPGYDSLIYAIRDGNGGYSSATVAFSSYGHWFNGDDDDNWLSGADGNDRIDGGGGDDRIEGFDGRDRIRGQGGHDDIDGGGGRDKILGGNGRDVLRGGGGNDIIAGGGGRDKMWGGKGRDTFDLRDIDYSATKPRVDLIKDFQSTLDRIDLTGSGLTYRDTGSFSGAGNELRYFNEWLEADFDGDGAADYRVALGPLFDSTLDLLL